ncbi:MAG: SpoIID/LytB domain-containing protein [Deltaproteobacteria bacterium]|nr:SpoIID/LytB domain-containing protein [Deltaproteobacteria bacterium]
MKGKMHCFLLGLLLLPSIRVAIFKNLPQVTLQGQNLWARTPEERPNSVQVENPVTVFPSDEGLQIGNETFASPRMKMGSEYGPVTVEGKDFMGEIEIRKNSENTLLILNELPLEEYLVGLVHGEIYASWPVEAIKAQVVAARTYALLHQAKRKKSEAGYDLEADIADQVYAGSMGKTEDDKVKEAVSATEGEVLWFLGYYPVYFHSTCGGQTEISERVWGKKDISVSVNDPFCKDAPQFHWELNLSQKQFLNALKGHGLTGTKIKSVSLQRHENDPRNALVVIETNDTTLFVSANELRKILGYKELKSSWFDVEWNSKEVTFIGTGYGHGVGLCQWGAKTMADNGTSYKDILKFYYPKAVLRKMY